jgi:hypothetical protein
MYVFMGDFSTNFHHGYPLVWLIPLVDDRPCGYITKLRKKKALVSTKDVRKPHVLLGLMLIRKLGLHLVVRA